MADPIDRTIFLGYCSPQEIANISPKSGTAHTTPSTDAVPSPPSTKHHPADRYRTAHFEISAAKLEQLPQDNAPEVAFAGRSNAGKSSAINRLCGQKALARTSKTPGRTQLINLFTLAEGRHLVDLPGYGYAKVAEDIKRRWQQTMEAYLAERQSLRGLILLMDVRHPLKNVDRQLLAWCWQVGMPVHVLLTKADKLKRGAAQHTLLQVRRELAAHAPDQLCSVQLFSALKGTGLDEVYRVMDNWLEFSQPLNSGQKNPRDIQQN